jgi:hypothetical protein
LLQRQRDLVKIVVEVESGETNRKTRERFPATCEAGAIDRYQTHFAINIATGFPVAASGDENEGIPRDCHGSGTDIPDSGRANRGSANEQRQFHHPGRRRMWS